MTNFHTLSLRDYYSLAPQEKIAQYQKEQKRFQAYFAIAGSCTLGIGALLYLKKIRPLAGGIVAIPALASLYLMGLQTMRIGSKIRMEEDVKKLVLPRDLKKTMLDSVKRTQNFVGENTVKLLEEYIQQELPNLSERKNPQAKILAARAIIQIEFFSESIHEKSQSFFVQRAQYYFYYKILLLLRALKDESNTSTYDLYKKSAFRILGNYKKALPPPHDFAKSVLKIS